MTIALDTDWDPENPTRDWEKALNETCKSLIEAVESARMNVDENLVFRLVRYQRLDHGFRRNLDHSQPDTKGRDWKRDRPILRFNALTAGCLAVLHQRKADFSEGRVPRSVEKKALDQAFEDVKWLCKLEDGEGLAGKLDYYCD